MADLPTVGDRVELVRCTDPYTRLVPGDTGIVTRVSPHPEYPTVSISWDSGSGLMLIAGVDQWKVVS